jgi:membrane protease YdiL (CAAX protease family)
VLSQTIQFQIDRVRSNRLAFILVLMLATAVTWFGHHHDAGNDHANVVQATAYLFAMWLCSFFIDMYALAKRPAGTFIVRRPVTEFVIVCLCALLGGTCIILRFEGPPWDHAAGLYRITVALGMMLFLFPIAMTIILLAMGYKVRELGVRLQGFISAAVVVLVTAVISFVAAPGHFTLQMVLQEGGGVAGALLMGFVYAGLSEEVFRFIFQTRAGAALRNPAAGWFLASLVWALLHGPKWYSEDRNFVEVFFSCLRIVPLGLMWGYLTHRTKSILPSVCAHGLNVWGLQNF